VLKAKSSTLLVKLKAIELIAVKQEKKTPSPNQEVELENNY